MMREIPLTSPGGFVALIDEEDLDLVSAYSWHVVLTRAGMRYARASVLVGSEVKSILMHRLVAAAPPKKVVDHWDRDGLHNWRDNLRVCGQGGNMANRVINRGNKTGFKGVSPFRGRYRAHICLNRRRMALGVFPSAEEAAAAYDDAARGCFGEFARVNFPRDGEQGCRPVSESMHNMLGMVE